MGLLEKIVVFGFSFVLLTNLPEFVESKAAEMKLDRPYVSTVVRKRLTTVLEASINFNENFTDDEKTLTETTWERFDREVDLVILIVDQQAELVTKKWMSMDHRKALSIGSEAFAKAYDFRKYYLINFVDCLVKLGKDCGTRKSLANYWLSKQSTGRKDLNHFINDLIVKKHPNQIRILDIVLLAHEGKKGGNTPQWSSTESVQNTMYNIHEFLRGIVIQMYRMILYIGHEEYLDAKANGWKNATDALNQMDEIREEFRKTLNEISKTVEVALSKAPRDIRPSDPLSNEKDVTYIRLTRFVSAALIKSQYVKYVEGSDEWFYDSRQPVASSTPNYHQDPYKAWGNPPLRNCTKYFPIVHSIWINESDSERIYHHWDATNHFFERNVYGKYSGDNQGLVQYGFQEDVIFLFRLFMDSRNEFSLCWMEYSREDNHSIRKFSSLPVRASDNNVVTGIRWVLKDQVIYPQIQEGKMVRGAIDPESVSWKEIVEDPNNYIALDIDRRSVNLDDIILPEGWFVTGFQFTVTHDEKALSFGIFSRQATSEGRMIPEGGNLELPDFFASTSRQEIILDEPDVSENAPLHIQHRVVSESGKHYVRFQPADLKKDGGQTTVPYLDIRDVVTEPPAPISGIGIYYKQMEGFGGFIGLKLISADVILLLEEEVNQIFTVIKSEMKE